MDYWSSLPPVAQLPAAYRAWAWWLRHGPRRGQGTLGGSRLFSLLRRSEPRYCTLSADDHPHLTIDLNDFEAFHHAIAIWYRRDAELDLMLRAMTGGGTFMDVGANYGVYALGVAHHLRVPVVAVEPQERVAEAIRRSAAASGLDALRVVRAAVSNDCGSIELRRLPGGSGSSSIVRHAGAGGIERETVPLTTLDRLCDDLGIAGVRCIKIDVEGAEEAVIEGASALLRRDRPFVIFESSSDDVRRPAILERFRAAGYDSFHEIGEPGSSAQRVTVVNVVAVPAGRVLP